MRLKNVWNQYLISNIRLKKQTKQNKTKQKNKQKIQNKK